MLTLQIEGGRAKALVEWLLARGAMVDLRNPDIVRIAPSPLYGSMAEVQRLAALVRGFFAGAGRG
jgi:kynureninase